MTHPPIAQNLKQPPLKVFWGEDYATLSRECRQIAGRRLSAKPARKPRKPTLASVTKQARKAGIDPSRIEIKPDGTYVVDIDKPHADEVTPLEQWRKRRGQG
jgi:hypothetical protein